MFAVQLFEYCMVWWWGCWYEVSRNMNISFVNPSSSPLCLLFVPRHYQQLTLPEVESSLAEVSHLSPAPISNNYPLGGTATCQNLHLNGGEYIMGITFLYLYFRKTLQSRLSEDAKLQGLVRWIKAEQAVTTMCSLERCVLSYQY